MTRELSLSLYHLNIPLISFHSPRPAVHAGSQRWAAVDPEPANSLAFYGCTGRGGQVQCSPTRVGQGQAAAAVQPAAKAGRALLTAPGGWCLRRALQWHRKHWLGREESKCNPHHRISELRQCAKERKSAGSRDTWNACQGGHLSLFFLQW